MLGEALIDIARLSSATLGEVDDPRLTDRILAIRRRAIEGLEDLKAARDARARDQLRARRLTRSLRELTARFQAQTRILAELRAPTPEPAIPDEIAWALYAVAEEALHGLERRSRATGIVMVVQANGDEISLSIRDDGVGLLARQGTDWRSSPHTAVRIMKRSLEAVGGVLSVTAAQPRGLLLRAVIPVRLA